MQSGITLEAVWDDPDILEVVVSARSASFSGAASLYTSELELREAAAVLSQFPRSPSDSREVLIGSPGHLTGGEGLSMAFLCLDGAGHPAVHAKLRSGASCRGIAEQVELLLPVEPAGIDDFVKEILLLAQTKKGKASLRRAR